MKRFLGVAISVLVLLLGWLLLSSPAYAGLGIGNVPCRPIVGQIGANQLLEDWRQGVDFIGSDNSTQSQVLSDYYDRLSGTNLPEYYAMKWLNARLAVGRACQDARLNRQTEVNITLAALVVLLIPVGINFTLNAQKNVSPARKTEVESETLAKRESE